MAELIYFIFKLTSELIITNSYILYLISYIYLFQIDTNYLFEMFINKRLVFFILKKLFNELLNKNSNKQNLEDKTEIELLKSQGMIYAKISSNNLNGDQIKEIIKDFNNVIN